MIDVRCHATSDTQEEVQVLAVAVLERHFTTTTGHEEGGDIENVEGVSEDGYHVGGVGGEEIHPTSQTRSEDEELNHRKRQEASNEKSVWTKRICTIKKFKTEKGNTPNQIQLQVSQSDVGCCPNGCPLIEHNGRDEEQINSEKSQTPRPHVPDHVGHQHPVLKGNEGHVQCHHEFIHSVDVGQTRQHTAEEGVDGDDEQE